MRNYLCILRKQGEGTGAEKGAEAGVEAGATAGADALLKCSIAFKLSTLLPSCLFHWKVQKPSAKCSPPTLSDPMSILTADPKGKH